MPLVDDDIQELHGRMSRPIYPVHTSTVEPSESTATLIYSFVPQGAVAELARVASSKHSAITLRDRATNV